MRPRCLAATALALVGLTATGAANGRPPQTSGIYLHPRDEQAMFVRTTFGLLVSHDGGCSFRWICEKAVGYGGEFDPKYAIAIDGTIFATTFEGLRVSRDGGCTWSTATAELPQGHPGRIAEMWIDAIDIAADTTVWVATAESARPNDVYRSTDGGTTFAASGLASSTIWWKSVRTAPGDARRVFATGYQIAPDTRAFVHRSDDGGQTWNEVVLPPTVQLGATPVVHVLAIDPRNRDHVFLRALESVPPQGDRLYRSTDGGATLVEVLATTEPIRDVVFRTSGTVLVAVGASGTYESQAGGAPPFVRVGDTTTGPPHLACLAQRTSGELVGCGTNWQPDFKAVGAATDVLAWRKLFRFVELAGPVSCPAGTTSATECDPAWPTLATQFGVTGPPAACGGATDAPAVDHVPKRGGGGCCGAASGDATAPIGMSAAVLAGLLRRRRRSPRSRGNRAADASV